jgi:hypothetical protein
MRMLLPAVIGFLLSGCGERPDELTPYVAAVEPLQKYHETLVQYGKYLKTEGMTNMAKDIRQVIEKYKIDLEALPVPKDKKLKAAHNSLIRTLESSLTKLVQPDFPTFVPSANKQIARIEKRVTNSYNGELQKQWERADKTDPFPLAWPGE